jgi:hypothetical protein
MSTLKMQVNSVSSYILIPGHRRTPLPHFAVRVNREANESLTFPFQVTLLSMHDASCPPRTALVGARQWRRSSESCRH